MSSITLQGPWRRALLLALIPITLILLYIARESSLLPPNYFASIPYSRSHPDLSGNGQIDPSMTSVVKSIFRPFIHPMGYANFTDDEGDVYKLSGPPRFTAPLGKRLLILDVDSRPLANKGELMHEELPWKDAKALSIGILSHYMYAMIHGYDYKFIRAPSYEDRWGTWVKVPMMKEALKTHDYVVFMDSDVMFHYPHLPLEWLMNYWGMSTETLAMMAVDPDEPQNYDQQKKLYYNTGFVISQQSPRTQEMYDAWANCPTEQRYEGCGRWKTDWAHEQAAFGEFLRYDYNRTEDIKVLPCTEANGAPEAVHRGGCKGTFVRHNWIDKGLVRSQFSDSIMQYIMPGLHADYRQHADDNVIDAKGFKYEGANLVEMTEEEKEQAKNKKDKNLKNEGW